MKKFYEIWWVVLLGICLSACEKTHTDVVMPERPHVGEDPDNPDQYYDYVRYSAEGRLRDSVYLYTYYFYLWQDQLPTSYPTHQHRRAEEVLEAMKGYARDGQGRLLDRFSFLDREGTIRAELQHGLLGSFGFDVRYYTETDLYIKKVDLGSPAYQAGLRRGWQVTEVNGRRDLSLASMEQDNYSFLFGALYGSSIDLKVRNPLGEEIPVRLHAAVYPYKPIITHRIFDLGTKKVGYMALDAFVTNQLIKHDLDAIMNSFHAAGVQQVIMDLRYNGGGDVATANYITNLLAPSTAHSRLMNYYVINNTLRGEGWDLFLFAPTYFQKTNALELDRVYFLVTNGTASASELLINNLTPYMDVQLIGDNHTYGKPVGYFGWDIMGVDLYAVSFQTLNAQHEGQYFDGLPVDKTVRDDLSRDFGDPDEWMTAEALHHALHGSYTAHTPLHLGLGPAYGQRALSPRRGMEDLNQGLETRLRREMFDFRKFPLDSMSIRETTPINNK